MPLIRERLAAGESVRFSPHGTSMLPLLKDGRDQVILSPLPDKLKKYDLPLYQRENGQYVLHRIVKVRDDYTCMGDNQFVPEKEIRHDQMIAVVTHFVRKGKEYPTESFRYKAYCRVSRMERCILPLIPPAILLLLRMACSSMRALFLSRREVCTGTSTSIPPRSSGRLSERENPSVLALTRTVLLSPRPRMNSWPVR